MRDRWRKKPVVIEAYQFNDRLNDPMPSWLTQAIIASQVWYQGGDEPYLTISTLEGEMRADLGAWVIRGVKGELYPCRDDIFRMTYEPDTQAEAEPVEALPGERERLIDRVTERDDRLAALQAHADAMAGVLRPFADACEHLHPSHPNDGETLDGFKVAEFRSAYSALRAYEAFKLNQKEPNQ